MRIAILLLFVFFNMNAQETNKLDDKGLKHGLWKGYYEESKRLRYEGTFDHGKEIGMFKFFDDTKAGTVIATREFKATDNSCYTIFYNQKGFKVSEGKLINKVYEGEWKYYHLDSPSIMTTETYVKGKLEGTRKVFYKEGAIAEELHDQKHSPAARVVVGPGKEHAHAEHGNDEGEPWNAIRYPFSDHHHHQIPVP